MTNNITITLAATVQAIRARERSLVQDIDIYMAARQSLRAKLADHVLALRTYRDQLIADGIATQAASELGDQIKKLEDLIAMPRWGTDMTAFDKQGVESSRRLAAEYREDVRWHIAKARKALETGDVEEARWRLSRAKVWRVRAHHWAQAARERPGPPGVPQPAAARLEPSAQGQAPFPGVPPSSREAALGSEYRRISERVRPMSTDSAAPASINRFLN